MPSSPVSAVRIIDSSRSRAPPGSSRVRIRPVSAAVGVRVTGTGSGTASGNPVAASTSATSTPGCTERSRITRSALPPELSAKSSTARLVTTTRSSHGPGSPRS